MATKYDLLDALIHADEDRFGGDERGLHHIISGIVGLIEQEHGGEELLADAIFDLIADCYTPTDEGS